MKEDFLLGSEEREAGSHRKSILQISIITQSRINEHMLLNEIFHE